MNIVDKNRPVSSIKHGDKRAAILFYELTGPVPPGRCCFMKYT